MVKLVGAYLSEVDLLTSQMKLPCIFFFKNFISFWLSWVFVALWAFSLIVHRSGRGRAEASPDLEVLKPVLQKWLQETVPAFEPVVRWGLPYSSWSRRGMEEGPSKVIRQWQQVAASSPWEGPASHQLWGETVHGICMLPGVQMWVEAPASVGQQGTEQGLKEA